MNDNIISIDAESLLGKQLNEMNKIFPEIFVDGALNLPAFLSLVGGNEGSGTNDVRYGFEWYGKSDALKILRIPSEGALLPLKNKSFNFQDAAHVVISGENLEIMKLMQKSYFGAFKMIYMDPPYNTGSDFIFDDNLEAPLQHYYDVLQQLKEGNYSSNTKNVHSRWLTMMLPRLFAARNLLSKDGVVFVSIDDHESHYLRLIMDEIFGSENFVCTFAWEKRYAPAPDATDVAYVHENILCYRRSDAFHAGLLPMTDEQKSRYTNPDGDPRGPWKAADYTCRFTSTERPSLYYPIVNPNTGKEVYPKPTRVWANSPEEHQKNVEENRIWWPPTASTPAKKSFLSEIKQGGMPMTLLKYEIAGHTDEATKEIRRWFPGIKVTSKPTKLMKHLITVAGVKKGDLILDCFAGTGTMAEAVVEMNEKDNLGASYVLIQFPEPLSTPSDTFGTVADLAYFRATSSAQNSAINDGVRCFELSTSSFNCPSHKKPANEVELAEQLRFLENNIKEGRSQADILFEIMLSNGLKLTEKIQEKSLCGVTYFSLTDGALLICLANNLSQEFFDKLVEQKPNRVICLDAAFEGNDQMKTNTLLEMRNSGIRFSTV